MDIALLDMQSQRYRRELEKKKQALAPTEATAAAPVKKAAVQVPSSKG